MKYNLLKSIFISLILLMGVGNVWAYDIKCTFIYDNSKTQWSSVQLMVGHGSWSQGYKMTQIANTQLWYYTFSNTWGGATQICVFNASSVWGGEGSSVSHRSQYMDKNTAVHDLSGNMTNGVQLITTTNGNDGTAMSTAYHSSYTELNTNQNATVQSTTNGSTYSDNSNAGSVSISTYKLKSTSASESSTGTTSASAARTASVSMTATAKTGYTFVGWYNSSGTRQTTNVKYTYTCSGSTVTYYARFKANQYTIQFNANGGSGTMSNQSYAYGVSQALTANKFTRAGYTFAGWNTKADGTGTSYTDEQSVSNLSSTDGATVTLYAQWTEKTYSLTFKHDGNGTIKVGGTTVNSGGTASVNHVNTKALVATPNTGYNFSGWTLSGSNTSAVTIGNTSAASTTIKATNTGATVTANFTPKTYTITLNANGGASDGSATATYNKNTVTSLTQPSRTDYRCNGYYTATSGGTLVLNIDGTLAKNVSGYTDANGNWTKDGNATLYAQWTYDVTEYTVNFGAGTGFTSYGTVTAKNNTTSVSITSPAQVRSGQSITFTATPQTGYEVEGWYTNADCTVGKHDAGKTTYTTLITDATNVYVKFVEKTWSVAFTAGAGGAVSPKETQTVGEANGVTIIATPNKGYSFTGWTSSNGGSFNDAKAEKTTFYPTAATTVTANFTENLYAITVKSSDNNHGTVTQSTDKAGIATTIAITATPVLGYRFVNWTATSGITIADDKSTTTTITTSAAGTVTANFELIPPTTIYIKSDGNYADFQWNYNSTAYKMEKVDCDGTYYTADILGGVEEITLTGSNSFTTTALTVPTDGKTLYDLTSTNITHLYLKPNSNWIQASAEFAAAFLNSDKSKTEWVRMTDIGGTTYSCAIPAGTWKYVIFCRMNPNGTDTSNNKLNWQNKWDQTNDLTIPTDGKNQYAVAAGAWSYGNGTWSTVYDNNRWTTFDAPTLELKINITGKGSIVIDGEAYTSDTDTKTFTISKPTGESITVGAITPADRWALTSSQITMCDNTVDLADSHTINGDASIELSFTQTSCEVVFDLNLPNGVETPSWSIANQYIDFNGTATEPSVGEIGEYLFGGWYKNGSTFTDANKYDFSTPATGDLTLYARWIPYAQCIFFKNNLKWSNVYVYTFAEDAWDSYVGVKVKGKYQEYGKMTQIGQTDVYYYILTGLTGFSHIAFSETDMHNNNEFYGSKAIYRGDRFDQLPLFIPQTDQKPTTTNQTKYYSNGIWMKYNSTYSGYDWSGKTGNEDWGNHKLTTENAGSFSFTTTVSLNAGTTYEFKISHIGRDADNNTIKDNAWYGKNNTTFTPSKHSNITFYINNDNAKITPTVDGQYTFTIYLGDGNVVVSLDYPLLTGDYRLAYKDDIETTLRGGDYIKKWNEESVHLDTTSFFVRHDKNPQIVLQHCTAITDGVPTWTTDATYNINSLSSTDVYNFVLKQNNAGSTHSRSVETSLTHLYSGNYYIRTDIAPGGWNTYKQNSHAFTHFNKYDDETYNHYWVGYTEYSNVNTKARIANDYNSNLSTELVDYNISNANVRFSYNNETNEFDRAFLGGSTMSKDFLKLVVGDNFAEGKTFTDISNWVYEVTVKATKGTTADVRAKHDNVNNKEPYNLRDDVTLLGAGSSEGEQTIRVIYDFKKNRMICGWLPGSIDHSGQLVIDADMLVVRVDNKDASTINMENVGDKISDLNRLYFVLELTKKEVIENETNIFWFSLPFECKLKDVFGIEGYGTKWVVQRYRGDKRAEFGFRPEIETFWANMKQSNTATLEPNRGYVVSLNLKESDFKSIDIDDGNGNKETKSLLRLYFPSNATEFTLSKDNDMTVEVPEHLCEVNDPEHNRKPLDSHWNIIGVPGYQPVTINGYTASYPEGGYYPDSEEPDDPTADKPTNGNYAPNFLYTWNGTKDDYTVQDGSKFTYKHFYSYMVQFAGTIDWSQYTQSTNPAAAPRRMAKKADKRYKVVLGENGANVDQTFITLSEKGNHDYSIGNDLEKIGSTSVARIYTQEGNWNLAANHLSDTTTVLPLTLSIPAEGEYTLSLEQGRYSTDALLYDSENGTYTDLSKEGYTFTAEAGVNNERFALRFGMKLPGGNATDLQQSQAQYLVRTEGQRIIIEGMAGDVRLYDMTGRVMIQQRAENYTEITVPVTGVYVLQVGNQFEKMIIK